MTKLAAVCFGVASWLGAVACPVAAFANGDEVVQACVHRQTGQARVVAEPSACRPNEAPASWNERGPQGPPGGPLLRVRDADGVDLGPLLPFELTILWTWNEPLQIMVPLDREDGTLVPTCGQFVFFELPGCQGQGWIASVCHRMLIGPIEGRFVVATEPPTVDAFRFESRFIRRDGCEDISGEVRGRPFPFSPAGHAPLREVSLEQLGFGLPRTPPLYLVPGDD